MTVKYAKAIDILNEMIHMSDWDRMMINHGQYDSSKQEIATPEDLFVALGLPPADVEKE